MTVSVVSLQDVCLGDLDTRWLSRWSRYKMTVSMVSIQDVCLGGLDTRWLSRWSRYKMFVLVASIQDVCLGGRDTICLSRDRKIVGSIPTSDSGIVTFEFVHFYSRDTHTNNNNKNIIPIGEYLVNELRTQNMNINLPQKVGEYLPGMARDTL
jgi:hypothetical protein